MSSRWIYHEADARPRPRQNRTTLPKNRALVVLALVFPLTLNCQWPFNLDDGLPTPPGQPDTTPPDQTGPPPSSDADYYVSPQGDDQADGTTQQTAFRSIGRALRNVAPGNTILILPGTYTEDLTLEGVGSSSAAITIRGQAGPAGAQAARPILDGQRTKKIGLWCDSCTNIVVENLEIRDYTDVGIGCTASNNFTLQNLIVHDNGFAVQLVDWEFEGYGIHVEESRNITIADNEVYRNGPNPKRLGNLLGTGINTFSCTDMTIRNNFSHDNTGGGMLVEDSVNVLVEGNQIIANDLDATAEEWWDGALWIDGGRNVTVRDNTFQNNFGPGIQISDEDHQSPTGYVLENNVVTGNEYGLYVWNFGTAGLPSQDILRLSNNQITGNTRQDIWTVAWECPPPNPCEQ